MSAAATFQPAGADMSFGDEPEIARRLNILAHRIGKPIYAISGHRTPAHSVAVGGFSNDPHTRGQATDIGVGSMLRSSAGQLSEGQLNAVGLTRPFPGAQEINHIQLLPGAARPKGDSGGGIIGTAGDVVSGVAHGAAATASAVVHPEDTVKAALEAERQQVLEHVVPFALKGAFLVGGAALGVWGLITMLGQQDSARAAAHGLRAGARAAGTAAVLA